MWGWIVLGIIALLIISLLSLKVTFIVTYKNEKLISKFKFLFIQKEFDLINAIENLIAPKPKEKAPPPPDTDASKKTPEAVKKDPLASIKNIYTKDGVAGIIEFIQNVFEALMNGLGVFFRHFVIRELDVNMVIADKDAALTAREYGSVCGAYYPFIGIIRNGMTVKKYHENIYADFLAIKGTQDIYFKGYISIKNLLGIVLKTAKTFLVNLRKASKENKKIK